ncbi:hypothetical protein ABK040_000606 [Willaertia magna]
MHKLTTNLLLTLISLCFLLLLLCQFNHAHIISYSSLTSTSFTDFTFLNDPSLGTNFTITNNNQQEVITLDSFQIGMFSKETFNFPIIKQIANGDSFIEVNLNLNYYINGVNNNENLKENVRQSVYLIIGSKSNIKSEFELNYKGKFICSNSKPLLKTEQLSSIIRSFDESLIIKDDILITQTDLYEYYLISCPNKNIKENEFILNIKGHLKFMNPFGHLPGQYFFVLPVQALLTICFLVFSFLWLITFILNRKEFLTLQFFITIVLLCCLMESIVVYLDYFLANKIGDKVIIITLCSIVLTLIRKVITCLIILLISSGYGTNLKISSTASNFLFLFSIFYILFCTIDEFGGFLYYNEKITSFIQLAISLPVIVLDIIFIILTLIFLYKTLNLFKNNNEGTQHSHYYQIYRKLFIVIILYSISISIGILLDVYLQYTGIIYNYWFINIIMERFWFQFSFFVTFCCIGYLYRPNRWNSFYLYAEQVNTNDDNDDSISSESSKRVETNEDLIERELEEINQPLDKEEDTDDDENNNTIKV